MMMMMMVMMMIKIAIRAPDVGRRSIVVGSDRKPLSYYIFINILATLYGGCHIVKRIPRIIHPTSRGWARRENKYVYRIRI